MSARLWMRWANYADLITATTTTMRSFSAQSDRLRVFTRKKEKKILLYSKQERKVYAVRHHDGSLCTQKQHEFSLCYSVLECNELIVIASRWHMRSDLLAG